MKKILILTFVLAFLSCAEGKKNLTPSETVKIVLKGLHSKDDSTLKKHTTPDGYTSLKMIENYIPEDNDATFEILGESVKEETAWVKYSTSYDGKAGVFKLTKVNGQWKVDSKGPRERGPF